MHLITDGDQDVARGQATRTIKVALAGNPNTGKTSLFNALTGSRQHVGNYPGVTVERRRGTRIDGDGRLEITDLPGTYGLLPWSVEERVALDELEGGTHDVVIVVVDATKLHRGLVFLQEVAALERPVVLCLNMMDEAEGAGTSIDVSALSARIGAPVVATEARRERGIEGLVRAAREAALRETTTPMRLSMGLERAVQEILTALDDHGHQGPRPSTWAILTAMRDDVHAAKALGETTFAVVAPYLRGARARLEAVSGVEMGDLVSRELSSTASQWMAGTVTRAPLLPAPSKTSRIDSILVHKILGLPLFFLMMLALFWVTFSLGEYPMEWLEAGFEGLAGLVGAVWPEGVAAPFRSLIIDGIIGGVGGVLVFLPNILLLFFGLSLMEDTGYMTRAAFLMDRLMRTFGLNGKSFIPLMTGFGCSIPAIMSTRIMDNERDRILTMLVVPLMSCGARLPIWVLLVAAFLPPGWRAPAFFGIYLFGVVVAFGLSFVLSKTVFKGDDVPFVMELPPYRLPTMRGIGRKLGMRSWLYVRKAGTIILAISVVMWALMSLRAPWVDPPSAATAPVSISSPAAQGDLEASLAGQIGHLVAPVFAPLGFDWRLSTALVGAFAAKEVFVAQMGIVYSMEEVDEEPTALAEQLGRDYGPAVGLALIVFLLVATPCMATVAVTRRETGGWKWPLVQFGGLTLLGYLLGALAHGLVTVFV